MPTEAKSALALFAVLTCTATAFAPAALPRLARRATSARAAATDEFLAIQASERLIMAVAVDLAPSVMDFSTDADLSAALQDRIAERTAPLQALLDACTAHAPPLVADSLACLPLARLAAWSDPEEWVRPLDEWRGPDLRSLEAHLLEKYPVPPALHGALTHTDGAPCSETGHRVALAFSKILSAAGKGDSVPGALKANVSPALTKAMTKAFAQAEVAPGDAVNNPVHALRRAQVSALGGAAWVGDAAVTSRLGRGLCQNADAEAFAQSVLLWASDQAELGALKEPTEVKLALDWACEMHSIDAAFTMATRTAKSVAEATEAYDLASIEFDDDERFQTNAHGVVGMFLQNATIPKGTAFAVPYDDEYNGGVGEYRLGGKGQKGSWPMDVQVREVLSLRRLIYEGEQLGNCLENKRSSQLKYVQRARQRVSSFWSLTYSRPGDAKPHHDLLIEVWHLREEGNIVRQAEGPRPRTIPGPEAWYWMRKWCKANNVDADAWNCYSGPVDLDPALLPCFAPDGETEEAYEPKVRNDRSGPFSIW